MPLDDVILQGNEKEDAAKLVEAFLQVVAQAKLQAKRIECVTLDNVDVNKAFVDALRKVKGYEQIEMNGCILHIIAIGMFTCYSFITD